MNREQFAKELQVMPIGKADRRNHERYHTTQQVRRVKPKRNTKTMKKLLATVGLSGLIAIGSIKGYEVYQEQTQTINLEQAFQMGKDIQSLGLTPELVERIETIDTVLEEPDTLSNIELLEIGQEIRDLQKEVVFTKLQTLTGEEDIKYKEGDRNDWRYSVTIGDTIYREKDILDRKSKIIGFNITDYIRDYDDYRADIYEINHEDFNRESYIKKMNKQINKIEKFAAGEMSIDEKGNIKMEKTKQKQYEEMFGEKETDVEEER